MSFVTLTAAPADRFMGCSSRLPRLTAYAILGDFLVCSYPTKFGGNETIECSHVKYALFTGSLSGVMQVFSTRITAPAMASDLHLGRFGTGFIAN